MNNGPVFFYSVAFEATRIRELAERFPDWVQPLEEILDRLVDFLPVARNRDYHPRGGSTAPGSLRRRRPLAAPQGVES
jgi:hypothetical protein